MFSRAGAALALATLVASCGAVGPNYQQPTISLEQRFALDPNSALHQAAQDAWWQTLQDNMLDGLMQRALTQNLDVQTSVARIRQAQAQVRATGPSAQLSGDASASARAVWTEGDYSDTTQVQIGPSFVLDLFGAQKRRQEAALADMDRAVFDAASSRLALQLELVISYLDLRYFQDLEGLRNRAIRNQVRVVDAVREREALNAENRMTLRRAEAELQLQRALVPTSKQGQNAAILRIATLLAEPYGTVNAALSKSQKQPQPAQNMAPGVPAGLLKNRPDVRAAEASLRAAVAQVGVTEAQLYPSLSLDGSVSATPGSTVSLGPTLSVPVFNRTVRRAARDTAIAAAEEAELAWRATVLSGVEEVQVNLSQLTTSDQQVTALVGAVAKFREAARLSRDAFQLQAITHVEILDVEDSLTQAELRLIDARRTYGRAWAQLNVAIGQGWRAYVGEGQETILE